MGDPGNSVHGDGVGSKRSIRGSTGRRRGGEWAGEAPVRVNGDGWKRKRGRRPSGAFTTDSAAVMLQNGEEGRRHCGMAEAAAVSLQEGGTAAAALQDGGSLVASRLSYPDWGRTARDRGRLARWRRKRRRRLQRRAKTSAAILQGGETAAVTRREAATWARFLFPYPLSLTGYPRSGFLSLSHVIMETSHQREFSFFISKTALSRYSSSLPYIGERKRGVCPKGSPVIQGVWPKKMG